VIVLNVFGFMVIVWIVGNCEVYEFELEKGLFMVVFEYVGMFIEFFNKKENGVNV